MVNRSEWEKRVFAFQADLQHNQQETAEETVRSNMKVHRCHRLHTEKEERVMLSLVSADLIWSIQCMPSLPYDPWASGPALRGRWEIKRSNSDSAVQLRRSLNGDNASESILLFHRLTIFLPHPHSHMRLHLPEAECSVQVGVDSQHEVMKPSNMIYLWWQLSWLCSHKFVQRRRLSRPSATGT